MEKRETSEKITALRRPQLHCRLSGTPFWITDGSKERNWEWAFSRLFGSVFSPKCDVCGSRLQIPKQILPEMVTPQKDRNIAEKIFHFQLMQRKIFWKSLTNQLFVMETPNWNEKKWKIYIFIRLSNFTESVQPEFGRKPRNCQDAFSMCSTDCTLDLNFFVFDMFVFVFKFVPGESKSQ